MTLALATCLATLASPSSALADGCHRGSRDSDRDLIPDCWEGRNGLVVGRRDALTDKDHDGLLAIHEFRLNASAGGIFGPYRANDPNSDNDGGFVKFSWEFPTLDGWEDLDGDGFINTAERIWRTNGASALSFPSLPVAGCIMVPGRVAHDGSKNVTLFLQAVLDTVPDGRCLRFRRDGRYRHNGTLKVVGRNDLTIEGNGAVLFTDRPGPLPSGAANSKRPHLQVIAGQNVTIDDLSIVGPNRRGEYKEVYESEHGFDVKGAIGLTIRNSSVRRIYGDFVFLDDTEWPIHTGIRVPTTDLLVTGNDFRVGGRHGLGVSGNAVGVRFEANLVRRVFRSGIDFEMHPGRSVSQFEIVGNTFQGFRHNWIAAGEGAVTDSYFGFNSILGDSMHSKMAPRTVGVFHDGWVFEGNVSDTQNPGDRSVFTMARLRNFTFIGNIQPMADGGAPVFFIYSEVCGITQADNSFSDLPILFDPAEPPPC